jgi:DNA-binding FrmR family transcriptional regulator
MGYIAQMQKKQKIKTNPDHAGNIVALRRIEGQVRGVLKMIEDKKYCIDILTQISAIKGALSKVEEKILEKHFRHCVTDAVTGTSEKEKDQKLDEILKLIHRTRKG